MSKRSFALFLLCVTTGCSLAPGDPDKGGVSAEDARALDDAAQKLDSENELKDTRQSD